MPIRPVEIDLKSLIDKELWYSKEPEKSSIRKPENFMVAMRMVGRRITQIPLFLRVWLA